MKSAYENRLIFTDRTNFFRYIHKPQVEALGGGGGGGAASSPEGSALAAAAACRGGDDEYEYCGSDPNNPPTPP